MATKLQDYIQLADNAASQVTKNAENWAGFLNTASRLYRYSFPDQLMIHAQNPKASACAEFDLWSRRMNRHIRRGSKGIGLVGFNQNGYPRIRYVFDIADTQLRKNSANLFQWQYTEKYREIVIKALEGRFGISGEKGLVCQLEMIAVGLVNGYWKNYHKDIMYQCEGSFLEELDEHTVSVKFRLAAAASISYLLLSRCGFHPWQYLKSENFKDIPDFNTQRIIRVLGATVSESSERVLRTIAVTIYNHEHQKQAAQNNTETAPPKENTNGTQPKKTSIGEIYGKYKPVIKESILGDNAYRNACHNSDRQDAALECKEAVKRAVLAVENAEFMKLYYDMEKFRIRLLHELFNETYPALSSVKEPDKPKANVAQEDDIKEPKPTASGTADAENAGQDTLDTEEPTDSPEAEVIQTESNAQEMPAPCNFIITDDRLGEGGPKTKFRMNMEAIAILNQIESENRPATPKEQEILSRYVGWGGVPDAFEPGKAGWEKEYQELKAALTPEEYDSAKSSVLNAHYTCPTVIKAIYGAVRGMGFKSGNILDITVTGLIQRTWERVA